MNSLTVRCRGHSVLINKFLKNQHVVIGKDYTKFYKRYSVQQPQKQQATKANVVAQHIRSRMPFAKTFFEKSEAEVTEVLNLSESDFQLNWCLVPLFIRPQYNSHRNASNRRLVMLSYGKTDKNKALVVQSRGTTFDNFVTNRLPNLPWPETSKDLHSTYHRRMQREIAYHLSNVPDTFVHDGNVASSDGYKIRVITDNAVSALYLNHMILPAPAELPISFKPDILIQHVPGYEFTPEPIVEEFGGPQLSDLGVNREQLVITNDESNHFIVSGIIDSKVLADTIVYAASKIIATRESAIMLPSDSIVSGNGDVTLVLGNTSDDIAKLYSENDGFALYGAHHNVISNEGVSRFWNGVSVELDKSEASKISKRGDLIEELDNGKVRFTTSSIYGNEDTVIPNLLKKPRNVVLMVNEAKAPKVSLITTELAFELISRGLSSTSERKASSNNSTYPEISPSAQAAKLEEFLGKEDVRYFVINKSQSSADIQKAIKTMLDPNTKLSQALKKL